MSKMALAGLRAGLRAGLTEPGIRAEHLFNAGSHVALPAFSYSFFSSSNFTALVSSPGIVNIMPESAAWGGVS